MHETKERILKVLKGLPHTSDGGLLGPTALSKLLNEDGGKETKASVVSTHLKGLVDMDLVEKVTPGKKRSLYRLIDKPNLLTTSGTSQEEEE